MFFAPVAPIIGQAERLPRATKEKPVDFLKRDAAFHLRVLRYHFRPRSIPSRNYKIKTIGNLEITSFGSTIKSTFESFEYHKVEDDMMIDINMEHQYLEPLDYTQTTEINLNQENGEMTTTISPSNGQATTVTCQLPPEYFQMGSNLKENKYVGFSDEIAYTMDMSYLEPIEVTLTLSIVGQEDITVDNGYYEDCYIVELLQEYEVMGVDQTMLFTIWITSDNITPQMEITTESMSISTTITMKLDDYYTTIPPEGNTVA